MFRLSLLSLLYSHPELVSSSPFAIRPPLEQIPVWSFWVHFCELGANANIRRSLSFDAKRPPWFAQRAILVLLFTLIYSIVHSKDKATRILCYQLSIATRNTRRCVAARPSSLAHGSVLPFQ